MVGARHAALAAAERLGIELWLLHPRELPESAAKRVCGAARLDLGAGRGAVEASARELVGGRAVEAVVAATEAAVLPAAWIRAMLGLPGLSVESAGRCTDKLAMKRAAGAAGIGCAHWEEVGPQSDPAGLIERLGRPIVLKLPRSSGSRGLVLGEDLSSVARGLAHCTLAERFVHGREMSVESLVAEGEPIFENLTEYLVPLHASILPAELDEQDAAAARALSRRVLRMAGIERGMAHVELFLADAGPVFGEVAARAPGGRLMQLLRRAYGFDPWEALLLLELGERPELPTRARACAGAWMLHPGPGLVRELRGLEAARRVPGVVKLSCRVRAGDRIALREGSGQDVGFIEAQGADRDSVAHALQRAHALLRFELLQNAPPL